MRNDAHHLTNPVFRQAAASPGTMFDLTSDAHPTVVSGWRESSLHLPAGGTHFGFVGTERAVLRCASGSFELTSGMYFAVPDEMTIDGQGAGFTTSLTGYRGYFQIGGPVEPTGRLRYIDGCSDSLLVAPPMQGDPCLNLLYIPPRTNQTAHTHPSLRIGMVVDGEGKCQTPGGDFTLRAEMVFMIHTDGLHSFHTGEEPLRIIAWHPDSDCGPTDGSHPMLNRTYVSGQPVNLSGSPS